MMTTRSQKNENQLLCKDRSRTNTPLRTVVCCFLGRRGVGYYPLHRKILVITMVDFETEFPSLTYSNMSRVILVEDVKDHCLDKQRVREVIHKVLSSDDWKNITDTLEEELFTELGL